MGSSNIEWTDKVWNPVTGCTKVSQGCKNCYAEGVADRFFARQYPANEDGSLRQFTDVRTHPDRLEDPLHWRKPARVFVNSMSDLFHEDVPSPFLRSMWLTMAKTPHHIYQVLTKRPKRMLDEVEDLTEWIQHHRLIGSNRYDYKDMMRAIPLPNVWLGVSVEDQATADQRIPLLLQTPAAVRFISAEPLLGPITLADHNQPEVNVGWLRGFDGACPPIPGLDWVIVGGESGPHARPCNTDWIASVVYQCREAGVPCFVKQVGARPLLSDGTVFHTADRKGGDMAEWPNCLHVREFPRGAR